MDSSFIIISLLIMCTGAFLLYMGVKGFGKDRTKLFINRCTETTSGTIDGFDDSNVLTRKKRGYYYYEKYQRTKIDTYIYTSPIVKFTVKGIEYRATYFRPMERKLNIGQKFKIQYNPENPYEYIIIGDKYLKTNSMSAQSTGAFLLLLGFVVLLLGLGVIKF